MMRKWITSCIILLLFLLCMIYKNIVILGACEGLLLWYNTVLPSLLPFMILVNVMMQTDCISLLTSITGPMMRIFPGVSKAGSFAVTAGFLCGYPMGAKISANLVTEQKITATEGAFLLSFCNNVSPMFIIGVLFTKYIPEEALHLPFFLILLMSPLMCSQLFRLYYVRHNNKIFNFTKQEIISPDNSIHNPFTQIIDYALMDSFYSIVKVGLFMMLFSILIRITAQLIPGYGIWKGILLSSFEITSGLSMIDILPVSSFTKHILLMTNTSFGGLCAIFQTSSMIQAARLPIGPYIIEKLITAMVTSLLTYLYLAL